MRHEIFARVNSADRRFCALRELIFAIVKDCFFLLVLIFAMCRQTHLIGITIFHVFFLIKLHTTDKWNNREGVKHCSECHSKTIKSCPCVAYCSGIESEKNALPIDAYPSSFVSERKRCFNQMASRVFMR